VHPDGGVVAVVIVAIGDCPTRTQPHTCLSAPTSQDSVTTIVAVPTHTTCVCTVHEQKTCDLHKLYALFVRRTALSCVLVPLLIFTRHVHAMHAQMDSQAGQGRHC
jgi:hypothetical protein